MPARTATARWEGGLKDGKGNLRLGGGAFDGQYSFTSRFEEGTGTNPEELIGAAQAGCFSMALSAGLEKSGYSPNSVETQARVHLSQAEGGGFEISRIDLICTADIPDIDKDAFQEAAEGAKENCIISRALRGVKEVTLEANLVG